MDMFPLTVGILPIDIGASLSNDPFTTNPPRPGLDGRGSIRLYSIQ